MSNYRVMALATLVLVVAALLGGSALLPRANTVPRAASAEEKLTQAIAVAGEGIVYAEPDMAQVSLGVQTTAATAQEAQQRNAEQMTKVVDQILKAGIDRKDIRTSGINLYPTYDRRDGKSTPTGYQASNQVNVTVRDLKKVAAVLDGSVAVGGNTLGGISFGFQDDSRLRQEALTKAVENARGKADAIAKGLGVRIVGVQSVAEDGVSIPKVYDSLRQAAPSTAESTPVMPGQQTITGHIRVVYTY